MTQEYSTYDVPDSKISNATKPENEAASTKFISPTLCARKHVVVVSFSRIPSKAHQLHAFSWLYFYLLNPRVRRERASGGSIVCSRRNITEIGGEAEESRGVAGARWGEEKRKGLHSSRRTRRRPIKDRS